MPLEAAGRAAALEALFNISSNTYVALLEQVPIDGSGEVEVSTPGYGRILVQAWNTVQETGITKRCNVFPVSFGPYAAEIAIKGWAIYDQPLGGNLIASGIFFDAGGGQAGIVTVPPGEDVQFGADEFCLILGEDCPIVFESGPECPSVVEVRIYDNTNPLLPVLLNTKGPGAPAYVLGFNDTRPVLVEIDLDMAVNPPDWTQTYDADLPSPPTSLSYAVQTYTLEYVSPGGLTLVRTRFDQIPAPNCTWTEELTRSFIA